LAASSGWCSAALLNGVERDRHHARVELKYLKKTIESTPER
jgi:hypothetical protein